MNDKVSRLEQPVSGSSILVRQSQFFSELPAKLLSEMSQHFRLEQWTKSQYIDAEILLTRFHILLEGQMEMKCYNPESGREVTLDLLGPGDSFDIITLLDELPHDVILSPITDLKLMSVPMSVMRSWLWRYPEMNRQFMPYLARKMREQEELSAGLVLYDIATRLSRIILKFINNARNLVRGTAAAENQLLLTDMSDERLARMVGSVRQVVNKHLSHWKSEGIVETRRNQLLVKDLEALKQEAKQTQSSLDR